MIISSKVLFYKNLPSTNSLAASLLKEKELPEGTVIHTNFQSAGRGQTGNKWESEENKNLLISVVLFPSMLKPADQFLLSMAVSLGICDFLGRYISGISIKWPNDIYVNDDKIAGILIETSIMGDRFEYAIAGIGLNINQEKFMSDAPNPVSLFNLTGREFDLRTCLEELTEDLDKRYKSIIGEDFDLIRDNYISLLYRVNEWSRYRDSSGIFTGRVLNVTNSGLLKVEREDGLVNEFIFKEIEYVL